MPDYSLSVFHSLQDAITALFGDDVRMKHARAIAGGDINDAFILTLTDGTKIFMKSNTTENLSYFTAEIQGLSAIARTETIQTPHILGYGTDEERNCSFLLLEQIVSRKHQADYWETFGHQLAKMHQSAAAKFVNGGNYGFLADNYIGAGKQRNTPKGSWLQFFRECRLEPQFHRAADYFNAGDIKQIYYLLDHMGDILIEPKYPSLLHGDLWSGNVITGMDGRAWLIDPAAYVGHAEADLAMTELFGGFAPEMYAAYRETAPLEPGYEERRDLYNLYHLLNHLNLFGRAYLPSVKRILNDFLTSFPHKT